MLLSSYLIHYKEMTTSGESSTSMVRDLPPHLPLLQKFGDIDTATLPPISVYTSQGRLAALLNDEENNE